MNKETREKVLEIALKKFARYFNSCNGIPADRATIKREVAEEILKDTGIEINDNVEYLFTRR